MGTTFEHFSAPQPGYFQAREAVRQPVCLLASVRSNSGRKFAVEMADISEAGCQLKRHAAVEDGDAILITIPGFTSFSGVVVWVEDDAMGVRFDKRLHPAILCHIIGFGED